MAPEPALTTAYLSYVVLSNYPIIACQVLIFFESVRVLPGEVRMYSRMINRGKINIAEILFLLTKYLSLLAIISDAITNLTSGWLTVTGCKSLSWIYQMLLFFCTTLISTTLAWRCYVIFQRSHRVGVWLLLGLAIQFSAAMATAQFQLKMKTIVDGYCSYLDEDIEKTNDKPWYSKYGIWFLLYSFLFDSTLVVCTSWRLIKCVRGPSGLQRIGKLLFVNNLHYIAIVGGLNLLEFFIFIFFSHNLPTLLPVTIVVEIMIGMNLIIAEQDAAHGYGRSTTTGYTGMPSNYTGARPSSAGQSNWTDSKAQITTRGSTSRGGGLEGIRFDCNEEVLVDYDVTLTQMAPGAADTWSPMCPNGPEVDRFDRFVPGAGDVPFADKSRTYPSSTDAEPYSGQPDYASTVDNRSQSRTLYPARSNEQMRGQGASSSNTQTSPSPAPPGLSIRAIREQMKQNDASRAEYETRPLAGSSHDQQAAYPPTSGSSVARDGLKRSDSMGSFASQCTCQESIYSVNAMTTAGAQTVQRPHDHDVGQNDFEEIAQFNPDAPFADYRPQHGNNRGGGPGNAF